MEKITFYRDNGNKVCGHGQFTGFEQLIPYRIRS